MINTLTRTFWHTLRPTRSRLMSSGIRQEKWFYTVRNHRGNVVATGERWLISAISADLAAKYLAAWWVDESERRPTAGWSITCRPAWRTQKAVADIPAGWVVRSGHDDTGARPSARRPVPHRAVGLLRRSRTRRPVQRVRGD